MTDGLQENRGIARALRGILVAWGGTSAFLWLATAVLPGGLTGFLFIVGTGFAVKALVDLVTAKAQVLSSGEVLLWNGLVRLVSWDPAEGVLFLRNRRVDFVANGASDGGGIRVVYRLLGEELALRVPLQIQTLTFADSGVLTRESMPLSIASTIDWKVVDLNAFYLLTNRQLRVAADRTGRAIDTAGNRRQFEAAESWLRSMAEEATRAIVSKVGTGLLISDRLTADLPAAIPDVDSAMTGLKSAYRSATDSLAGAIKARVDDQVRIYGLEVHRVALQEVKLPPDIYAAAVEACTASYLPLKTYAEAVARKIALQAEVDVLGSDAVGLKEIAGNVPALALQDFLGPMFVELGRRRTSGAR